MSGFDRGYDPIDLTSTDDEAFDLLRSGGPSPDLSGRIMNRLGYMRVDSEVARRQRYRRAAARAGVAMLVCVMAVVAFQARGIRSDARQPAEVTLPNALDQVGHDVSRQRDRLGRLLQHIQVVPADPAVDKRQEDDEESLDELPLDDEVNQSGLLPYKWA